jgi:hypothetical protein
MDGSLRARLARRGSAHRAWPAVLKAAGLLGALSLSAPARAAARAPDPAVPERHVRPGSR